MKWANFLHVYQPADQQPEVLEAIVAQSYRPLFTHFRDNPKARITLNINGSLLELFDTYGYHDLIDLLKEAAKKGHIEFTGSAKYHAFLPFLSADEIERQIVANAETNTFYLGDVYKPKGFFPPEMAYKNTIVPVIESLGFSWILLDEIAYSGVPGTVDFTKLYKIKNSNLNVFFRERRLSNLIMSAVVRSPQSIEEAIRADMKEKKYVITAMDGETFGHHRPGLEQTLFDILTSDRFEFLTISEIQNYFHDVVEIEPITSTWASSKNDIDRNIQFLSWSDPDNAIHKMQWELLQIALEAVKNMNRQNPHYPKVRKMMDEASASDHFWWASAKPWWKAEMIEGGAHQLLETIRAVPEVPHHTLQRATELYHNIIATAFEWQRIGRIREMRNEQHAVTRIPFKEKTWEAGGNERGVYEAFINMMEKLEKEAREQGEYERAVLWRDARWKFEHKLDIYDAINAIDLLRIEIPFEEVERTLDTYTAKYKEIRGGQPEQRGA
jgi:predicted glycosyl hydrolase (DUF1957 family)